VAAVTMILRRSSVNKPGKAQVALESIFGGLANFFGEIVGPENVKKYIPFVGSLWLFILLNNWFALIPLFKSPTAHFQTTIGLGASVFLFVNFHGMKAGGVGHYFWHLCGSPVNAVGWIMAPLMLVLETVGTLVKPLSLSLRLYGNIFGEDKLLAIFLGLGMAISAAIIDSPTPLVGLPLHVPFLFLSVLLGLIQATVFAMLAAVYIALLLPHRDHDHHEEGHVADHGAHEGKAHA
jgi:F-type H+-transporting ATPase subunit a